MKKKKGVSKTVFSGHPWYLLPPFLQGVISVKDYRHWLELKGHNLRRRDLNLKRLFAKENSFAVYKQKIHQAVLDGGGLDPFTGEKLDWGLVSKKNELKKDGYVNNYLNTYALYPAVDHIIPEEFEFEICSLISNQCKSSLTPEEFVGFCGRVVNFRGQAEKSPGK
jgi:hypothetical protein